jgi:hypothetical protein
LLDTANTAAAVAKGGDRPRQRTPAEQLAADAFAMKRLAVRLHARLLERPLASLGAKAGAVAARELRELRAALAVLCITLDARLTEKEFDGRPE